MSKRYDANQVIRSVYDINTNSLRVSVDQAIAGPGGGLDIVIDHADDSIRIGDGINLVTTSPANTGKVAFDVVSLNELVPREFDDIEITQKNAEGDPEIAIYRSAGSVVATLTITYDIDGDLQRVVRS